MSRDDPKDRLPGGASASQHGAAGVVGWDVDAAEERPAAPKRDDSTPLTAQVLSLLSDPRIDRISAGAAARALHRPAPEIENAIEALVASGELIPASEIRGQYTVSAERKHELEAMFVDSAEELGEVTALARRQSQALAMEEEDEPRLPVTAGLLSLFLPGTGQLLNGDVGRASLVFAVWSLALLTHLSPIWTFVALYAGAEAFFTAKIRGMERKMNNGGQRALPGRRRRDEPAPGGATT